MTTQRTSSQRLKSISGASVFALGLLLLFVNLDGAAAHVSSLICTQAQASGMLSALGLAGLHALQAYTFDRTGFLSSLLQILVSFWPLILIAVGAILLRPLVTRESASRHFGTESSATSVRGDF